MRISQSNPGISPPVFIRVIPDIYLGIISSKNPLLNQKNSTFEIRTCLTLIKINNPQIITLCSNHPKPIVNG